MKVDDGEWFWPYTTTLGAGGAQMSKVTLEDAAFGTIEISWGTDYDKPSIRLRQNGDIVDVGPQEVEMVVAAMRAVSERK